MHHTDEEVDQSLGLVLIPVACWAMPIVSSDWFMKSFPKLCTTSHRSVEEKLNRIRFKSNVGVAGHDTYILTADGKMYFKYPNLGRWYYVET